MRITKCDACGSETTDFLYKFVPLDFKVKGYEFTLQEINIKWRFSSTNVDVCDECLIRGLIEALQGRLPKSVQSEKTAEEPKTNSTGESA